MKHHYWMKYISILHVQLEWSLLHQDCSHQWTWSKHYHYKLYLELLVGKGELSVNVASAAAVAAFEMYKATMLCLSSPKYTPATTAAPFVPTAIPLSAYAFAVYWKFPRFSILSQQSAVNAGLTTLIGVWIPSQFASFASVIRNIMPVPVVTKKYRVALTMTSWTFVRWMLKNFVLKKWHRSQWYDTCIHRHSGITQTNMIAVRNTSYLEMYFY